MTIMDKVLFWRHKDPEFDKPADLGLGQNLGLDIPKQQAPDVSQPHPMAGKMSEPEPLMSQPMQQYPQQPVISQNRDMELIAAKLDALKAMMENINHRLENIERMAKEGI